MNFRDLIFLKDKSGVRVIGDEIQILLFMVHHTFPTILLFLHVKLPTLEYRINGWGGGGVRIMGGWKWFGVTIIGGLKQSGGCLEKWKIVVVLGKHASFTYLCQQ